MSNVVNVLSLPLSPNSILSQYMEACQVSLSLEYVSNILTLI